MSETATPTSDPKPEALLTVQDVADRLRCSPRTVHRLVDARRVPPPLRIGSLVRWRQGAFEQWLRDGCPRIR